ncbi:alpha/beta hydrolase [Amycolatopsis dongchuanensis]|uniref:AB hydrolase-1 domain-containing protein n=1 Tax=Amycolatopsis dongchuanensis TaxID=1070866 RepID=A0ABP9PZN7_9PSEU
MLVAIPGTLCSARVFDRLAAELPDTTELDAVDWMSGSGPWRIDDVAARTAERIERHGGPVLVAGHSTGGCIALALAAARPELVSGLLLANTGAHMRGHGDVDSILDTIATAWGPRLHAAVLDRSFAEPVPPEFRETLLAYAAGVPQAAALEVLRSQRDRDLTPELPRITCPATVLHGVHDRARSAADAEALAAGLPDCEVRFVQTGHTPVWEDAPAAAAAVRELLARGGR